MRLCNGIHEKNQQHFVINNITVVMKTFTVYVNNFHHTSFCAAIVISYDKMVLKIFMNTVAKPHVKGFTVYSFSQLGSVALTRSN